jgi:hypothetical protein
MNKKKWINHLILISAILFLLLTPISYSASIQTFSYGHCGLGFVRFKGNQSQVNDIETHHNAHHKELLYIDVSFSWKAAYELEVYLFNKVEYQKYSNNQSFKASFHETGLDAKFHYRIQREDVLKGPYFLVGALHHDSIPNWSSNSTMELWSTGCVKYQPLDQTWLYLSDLGLGPVVVGFTNVPELGCCSVPLISLIVGISCFVLWVINKRLDKVKPSGRRDPIRTGNGFSKRDPRKVRTDREQTNR